MSAERRIDPAEVRRIAALARLTLSDVEVDGLTRDLGAILEHVATLEALDTSAVEATTHAINLPTVLRDDVVEAGSSVERGLRGAPERIGDGFGVPKIIE